VIFDSGLQDSTLMTTWTTMRTPRPRDKRRTGRKSDRDENVLQKHLCTGNWRSPTVRGTRPGGRRQSSDSSHCIVSSGRSACKAAKDCCRRECRPYNGPWVKICVLFVGSTVMVIMKGVFTSCVCVGRIHYTFPGCLRTQPSHQALNL